MPADQCSWNGVRQSANRFTYQDIVTKWLLKPLTMNELKQTIEGQNGCFSFQVKNAPCHIASTVCLSSDHLEFSSNTCNLGCQLSILQELLQLNLQTNVRACQMLGLHDSSSTLLKLHTRRAQSLRINVALTQGTTACAPLPLIPHASLPVLKCYIAFRRQSLRDSECTQRPKLVLP